MSQAEQLLNSVSEEVYEHKHSVPDTDTHFIIDPITRKIENTNRKKSVVMQYDHNSERFTFELPRYIDGHDMSLCTSVTVNVDNIESVVNADGTETTNASSDAPDMTDLHISPDDPEKVISSWLISRNSTQLAGILSFSIEYKCVDDNGNVVYEWSTDTYDEIEVRARKKNGKAAVIEHTDLLEQWRTRIFGAGDSVMADIAAEGKTQVAAVKMESETQQEAVELKGVQTLDSIPEDYTEIDVMADEAVRTKADAIVCEAAGESIVLKDSSNDHVRGLKLFGKSTQKTTTGKNLCSINTITFTQMENAPLARTIPAGAYYVSLTATSNDTDDTACVINFYNSDTYVNGIRFDRNVPVKQRVEFTQDVTNLYCYAATSYLASENDVATFSDILVAADENTTYEPYTGGKPAPNPDYPQEIVSIENPTANVCGKNLLELTASTDTVSGVTFTINDDGTVAVNGTATESILFDISYRPSGIKANTKYFLCGCPSGGGDARYYLRVSDRLTQAHDDYGSGIKFKYSNVSNLTVSIRVMAGVTVSNLVFKPMVCAVNVTDHAFESYKSIQSIDITRTIPGIPITSGGNYTDSDGQQWICDEVDLERGVHIQRIYTYKPTIINSLASGSKNNRANITLPYPCTSFSYDNVNGCCSHFRYNTSTYSDTGNEIGFMLSGETMFFRFSSSSTITSVSLAQAWLDEQMSNGTPLTVTYILATPIETPLTAEEIEAFKALRTNYPNTTILNDAGAWMSVKYNADTKTYVENPKTLRLVDSSTGMIYELKIDNGSIVLNPIG